MTIFFYNGVQSGKKISGEVSASDIKSASVKLREKKINIIKKNNNTNYFFIVARNRYINDLANIFGSIVLNKDYKFNHLLCE